MVQGTGLNLRGAIQAIFQYPVLVIFAEGRGIAAARALIESTADVGGLNFGYRKDVRLYYRVRIYPSLSSLPPVPLIAFSGCLWHVAACPCWGPVHGSQPATSTECTVQAPNQQSFCYKDCFETWETEHQCKVTTSTRGTFQDMFDDDDTLMYEPETTAALIFTGGDLEAEEAALEVSCRLVCQAQNYPFSCPVEFNLGNRHQANGHYVLHSMMQCPYIALAIVHLNVPRNSNTCKTPAYSKFNSQQNTSAFLFILCEADPRSNAVVQVCKEAEITYIVKDSEQQPPTQYLKKGGTKEDREEDIVELQV